MPSLTFKVKVPKNMTPQVQRSVKSAVRNSIRTIGQDIARTASESAPHLTGDLEASYAVNYSSGSVIKATVEFSVFKDGFNYAMAMHEWTYKLGEGSRAKGGGTGMSGKSYPVGRKYLTRVLEGEEQAYIDYIKQKVSEALRG